MRMEVLAPVSIFARSPTMPSSVKSIHSRRPMTESWSNVFTGRHSRRFAGILAGLWAAARRLPEDAEDEPSGCR